mmetsp:Transcript_3843/g.9152  ORF Transcript_3843/g.9152 Transcript_3843/m.9152 type:complete len:349 (+) Transcript_3843:891-1937(+)
MSLPPALLHPLPWCGLCRGLLEPVHPQSGRGRHGGARGGHVLRPPRCQRASSAAYGLQFRRLRRDDVHNGFLLRGALLLLRHRLGLPGLAALRGGRRGLGLRLSGSRGLCLRRPHDVHPLLPVQRGWDPRDGLQHRCAGGYHGGGGRARRCVGHHAQRGHDGQRPGLPGRPALHAESLPVPTLGQRQPTRHQLQPHSVPRAPAELLSQPRRLGPDDLVLHHRQEQAVGALRPSGLGFARVHQRLRGGGWDFTRRVEGLRLHHLGLRGHLDHRGVLPAEADPAGGGGEQGGSAVRVQQSDHPRGTSCPDRHWICLASDLDRVRLLPPLASAGGLHANGLLCHLHGSVWQ